MGERVVEEPRERSPDPLARLGDRGRCGADGVGVQLVRRPEADENDSPGRCVPVRVQHRRPPGLGGDLLFLGYALGVVVLREPGQSLRANGKREDIRLRNRI